MKFFDEGGNRISCDEWIAAYEPYYFLDGPGLGRRITARNQTSRFVEDHVCGLLGQTAPLSQLDLTLAMAWKMGLIDHQTSELQKKVVFTGNWAATLTANTQFKPLNFSSSIPALAARIATVSAETNQGNPRYFFDLTGPFEGFGKVYRLTIIFFASHGRFPIYDRYAHVAAQAIDEGLPPEATLLYKPVEKWSDYEAYMKLLAQVRNAYPLERTGSPMFVSRRLDRALWVYGHFFRTNAVTCCL